MHALAGTYDKVLVPCRRSPGVHPSHRVGELIVCQPAPSTYRLDSALSESDEVAIKPTILRLVLCAVLKYPWRDLNW